MSEIELYDSNQFDLMEKVAERRLRQETPNAISKALGIPIKHVNALYEQYREILRNDSETRDIAIDMLNMMIKHYDQLIAEYYKLLDKLESENFGHQIAAQINSALKEIGNLEAKRLDSVQKAGLLENSELGDELVEAERKQELLISILKNDLCAICKPVVARRLEAVTGKVEVIKVTDV